MVPVAKYLADSAAQSQETSALDDKKHGLHAHTPLWYLKESEQRDGGPAMNDVLGGHVDLIAGSAALVTAQLGTNLLSLLLRSLNHKLISDGIPIEYRR